MATSPQPVQVSASELSRHNTKNDCWLAVHHKVWDLTDFVDEHPGGADILLQFAGTNATRVYGEVHAPGILEANLSVDKFKGVLEEASSDAPSPGTAQEAQQEQDNKAAAAEAQNEGTPPSSSLAEITTNPPLFSLISAADFEKVASKILSPKTWAFYSSAATDLITHTQNKALLRRIMIQPQILRDVKHVNMKSSILGLSSSAPFFISPAAHGPNTDESADERVAAATTVRSAISGAAPAHDKKGGGLGRLMAQYIDKSLVWDDIAWIRRVSGLPVVLKGVQGVADARMAAEYGADGIMLSNHGGRSLDT
ncbi:cytochrome b2 [Apiospora phragmitis]|uniref:Cytochrome b2 n=1 Tax=Apiospora phragmitis TaxID=2905665 RepID=A0ABR1TQR9_9PEZI